MKGYKIPFHYAPTAICLGLDVLSPPTIEDLGVLWPAPLSNFLQLVQCCSAQKLIFTGLPDLMMKFLTIKAGLLILMIV